MPLPRYDVMAGTIDGVNVVFTSVLPYTPGSTAVFLNGQLKRPDFDDGWVETTPAAGVITMKQAPQTLDVVQMFYLDTSPPATIVQAGPEPLSATIQDVSRIDATIDDVFTLDATIGDLQTLDASIMDVDQLDGSLIDVQTLSATLECT